MKLFLNLLLALLIFFNQFPYVLAQSEFDLQHLNYLTKIEKYNDLHEKYIIARATYLQYRTIVTKDEAVGATKAYLIQVIDVTESYLNLLKIKINDAAGATIAEREFLFSEIDRELVWQGLQRTKINQQTSLDNFPQIATDINERYKEIKKLVTKQIVLLRLYEYRSIKNGISSNTDLLDSQINFAQSEGKNVDILKKASLDIRQKLKVSNEKIENAVRKVISENRPNAGSAVMGEIDDILSSIFPISREIIRGLI
jgi:hypothetical protein